MYCSVCAFNIWITIFIFNIHAYNYISYNKHQKIQKRRININIINWENDTCFNNNE